MFRGRYLYLLISLILMIFASPYFIEPSPKGWVLSVFANLVMLTIVFSTIKQTYLFIFAFSFALLIFICDIYTVLQPNHQIAMFHTVASTLFYGFSVFIILRYIFMQVSVNQNMVFASLCVYLLIGLIYAQAYQIVELMLPGSYAWNSALYTTRHLSDFDLLYFSFTTLTTVGFGDILAISVQAKSIVIVEQITGVLYLAVLVSRLVGAQILKND